ncbi:hypothetical protein [Paractinoplanes durhamensis]|uniref:Uncharacterized protein n=1 Tax=Paractinoplanes durhamensis TaxID=113563 RepID=A0ABQ3Z071_9ACTN|nr:hypothetical protein [Actinoplanes durhamensis]GIE03230.1 hypothetical protein Adu01nite_45800 [Actinoplanes durhamensis]
MAESEDVEQNDEQPEEFQNRAARRAKSKKGGQSDAGFAQGGAQPHGRGTVSARRSQFGNRRTG